MDSRDAQNQSKSPTASVAGHARPRFDPTTATAQPKWWQPFDPYHTSTVAGSKCHAFSARSNVDTVRLLCSGTRFHRHASSASHTCKNDHHFRVLSSDIWVDSVVCQSQQSL